MPFHCHRVLCIHWNGGEWVGVCGGWADIGFLCFSLRWMKQSRRLDFLCCHRSDIDRTTCRQYLLLHSGQLLLCIYLVVSTGVWLTSFVAKQSLKTVFCDIKVPIFTFLGKLRIVHNVFDWLHKATEKLLLNCWFETARGRPVLLQLCSVSAVRWQTCARCCLYLPLLLRKQRLTCDVVCIHKQVLINKSRVICRFVVGKYI